jgi:hypothetical protein
MLFPLIMLAVMVLLIASAWIIFTKAGKPGWAAIVPIYNIWVMLEIVGRPGWWLILFLIPLVSLVIGIVVAIDLGKSFGKSTGFGLGLALLGFIFFPMLAFGDDTYRGPSAS